MTSPFGTPDDQAYTNTAGSPFLNTAFPVPLAGTSMGPFACGSFNAAAIAAVALASGITVTFNYYADEALTEFTLSYSVKLGSVAKVRALAPAPGNWLDIQFTNGGAAAATVSISVTPVNVSVAALTYVPDQNYLSEPVTSVPASGSLQFFLPQVQPGPAWLWWQPQDTSGKLTVDLAADSGFPSWGGHDFLLAGATAEADKYLMLPDLPMQVQVTNTDASSSHSFRLTLVPGGGT